jgi:hypothetical protein
MVAAETARAEFLAARGHVEQIVRLENLAARAVRRLNIKAGAEPKVPTIKEDLAARASKPVAGAGLLCPPRAGKRSRGPSPMLSIADAMAGSRPLSCARPLDRRRPSLSRAALMSMCFIGDHIRSACKHSTFSASRNNPTVNA